MRSTRRFVFLGALAAVLLILAACSQMNADPEMSPSLIVVAPSVEIDKTFNVLHSQSVRPVVTSKTADVTSVDLTGGVGELQYTIVVEDVVVAESDTATVADIAVSNTGSTGITVDIDDILYCGDGSGAIDTSSPVAVVVSQADVAIAALDTYVVSGPFDYDVSACPDLGSGPTKDVVNRLTVTNSGNDEVLAQTDFSPVANAISNIAPAFLVDEEVLPAGHTITAASLTEGGSSVAVTGSMSGNTYTLVTDNPVGAGTYTLTKTISRGADVACANAEVLNTAFMSGDGTANGIFGSSYNASIALICRETGGEGCTPGFWKEWTGVPPGNQPNAWLATGYDWHELFTSAGFIGNGNTGKTFLEVLELKGGGKNALSRHAVAALLNAAHPDVSYDLTEVEVVAMYNDVIENDGDVNGLKSMLEGYNEQGCPLSQAVW